MSFFDELHSYASSYPAEAGIAGRFADFLRGHADAHSRSCLEGHITGSAFIVEPEFHRGLFVHHATLGKWLQPGGHCEEGESALAAARREAFEETGVEVGEPYLPLPLDLDIHEIPARGGLPAHLHFDVRYLFVVDATAPRRSEESLAVEWLDFGVARSRNRAASIDRPLGKIEDLRIRGIPSKARISRDISLARPV